MTQRLRHDGRYRLEIKWCTDHGLPHSTLLSWNAADRTKLLAYLMDEALRCTSCGTADWEFDEDPNAYWPDIKVCRGCALRDQRRDDLGSVPGATIVLLSGAARKAAIARERAAYLAAKGRRKKDG